MDASTKERIQRKLQGMLDEIEGEAVQTVDTMRTEGVNFPDPTDRASLESDRNLTLRIRDRGRKLRDKIQEALDRLEAGDFGLCEICGDQISLDRLEARPVTTMCLRCKQEQEVLERKAKKGS